MTKAALLLNTGDAFLAQAMGKFRKDIVRIGKWIHPATGQEIKFDAARLVRLAANTEKYRKNADKQVIPFPDGHSFRAQDTIGYVEGVSVEGDRLVGIFNPAGKDVEEKLASGKIRSVSAFIDFNVKDSQGNVYDEAITHVAATPYPVVTGQEDFVKLSGNYDLFDLFVPEAIALSIGGSDVLKLHDHLRKELQARMDEHKAAHKTNGADHADTRKAASAVQDAAHRLRRQAEVIHSHTMNATGGPTYLSNRTEGISPEGLLEDPIMSKKLALALGLPEDATAEQIESAAVKAGQDLKALTSGRTALSALLEKEFGLKVDGEKVIKLSAPPPADETPREKEYRLELAQVKATQALAAAKDMAKKVEGFVKAGVVPPAKQEILSRLLAIPGKVQALALAADTKALQEVQVDVAADVEALLQDLPGLTTQRLAAGRTEDEKKTEELSAKKQDELVERHQGGGEKKTK
jgi:hypothetical protein